MPAPKTAVAGGGAGGWNFDPDTNIPPPSTNPEAAYADRVALHNWSIKARLRGMLPTLQDKVYVSPGTPLAGNLAQIRLTEYQLYDNSALYVTVITGLTDRQLKLVLSHEYLAHLRLIDISRLAGNQTILSMMNEELCLCLARGINEGHHEYSSRYMDEYERLLRLAFPGESEDFYRYGKWGGGLTATESFFLLPKSERYAIKNYLRKNKL